MPAKAVTTTSNTGFNPVRTERPKGAGGPGRSYSEDQLKFFADVKNLEMNRTDDPENDAWYEWTAPNVRVFVTLLRSAANYLTTKEATPTGVKIKVDKSLREIGADKADYVTTPGVVTFAFGNKGKPRGRGAKK